MSGPLTRAQILNALLPGLEKLFGAAYKPITQTEYVKRCSYGKYSIYRWDYSNAVRKSTTLARGLTKEEAEGMMKLLENEYE